MTETSRSWAAGYVVRALQLARDEAELSHQLDEVMEATAWLHTSPSDGVEQCLDGARTAPRDARRLPPDGAVEWVLLGAPNYRRANQLLLMNTSREQRAQLMDKFGILLSRGQDFPNAAHALVTRIESVWKTGVLQLPSRAPSHAPQHAPQHTPQHTSQHTSQHTPPETPSPVIHELERGDSAAIPTPLEPVPAGDIPLPDPSWFETFLRFAPRKFSPGEQSIPGTAAYRHQSLWKELGDWMETVTTTVLGPHWTGARHKNWQNGGNLYPYFWSKIFPENSAFTDMFHVGVQFTSDPGRIPIEQFDRSLAHFERKPVIAIWASASTLTWKRWAQGEPELVRDAMRIYDEVQHEALLYNPELWTEHGAGWRWRRRGGRGQESHAGADMHMQATGAHVLTPIRRYLQGVRGGEFPRSGSLVAPLVLMEDAVRSPELALRQVTSSLRIFGELVASTYQRLERERQ